MVVYDDTNIQYCKRKCLANVSSYQHRRFDRNHNFMRLYNLIAGFNTTWNYMNLYKYSHPLQSFQQKNKLIKNIFGTTSWVFSDITHPPTLSRCLVENPLKGQLQHVHPSHLKLWLLCWLRIGTSDQGNLGSMVAFYRAIKHVKYFYLHIIGVSWGHQNNIHIVSNLVSPTYQASHPPKNYDRYYTYRCI